MRRFHSLLQNNINVAIDESNNRDNNKVLYINEFHSKVQKIHITQSRECSICLDEIPQFSVCCALPCLHMFHENCLKKWLLLGKPTCPDCRLCI